MCLLASSSVHLFFPKQVLFELMLLYITINYWTPHQKFLLSLFCKRHFDIGSATKNFSKFRYNFILLLRNRWSQGFFLAQSHQIDLAHYQMECLDEKTSPLCTLCWGILNNHFYLWFRLLLINLFCFFGGWSLFIFIFSWLTFFCFLGGGDASNLEEFPFSCTFRAFFLCTAWYLLTARFWSFVFFTWFHSL